MAHDVADQSKTHMGLPLPNGKLALWIFLVTEITFFTALIGTYMLLRNGQPTNWAPWPAPHDVHLVEWIGALNTFVLICSSLRSEEHTSELQSQSNLVCRLLLEKKTEST